MLLLRIDINRCTHQSRVPASLSGIVCLPGKVLRDGSKLSQKFKLAQRGGPQLVQFLKLIKRRTAELQARLGQRCVLVLLPRCRARVKSHESTLKNEYSTVKNNNQERETE